MVKFFEEVSPPPMPETPIPTPSPAPSTSSATSRNTYTHPTSSPHNRKSRPFKKNHPHFYHNFNFPDPFSGFNFIHVHNVQNPPVQYFIHHHHCPFPPPQCSEMCSGGVANAKGDNAARNGGVAGRNGGAASNSSSNQGPPPAKFYFGPGFEPQRFYEAPGRSAQSGNKREEYIVNFHVNPGVNVNLMMRDGSVEIFKGSSCQEVIYSRKEIFNMIKGHLRDGLTDLINHLKTEVSKQSGKSIEIREDMKTSFSTLFSKLRLKLKTVNRSENLFFQKYSDWLSKPVTFPILEVATSSTTPSARGRPTKEFLSSSERSKRRKTEELRSSFSPQQLAYATQISLRSTGQLDACKLVKEAALSTPTRALKYRKSFKVTNETPLTSEGALSILIECKLSKSQYQGLRSISLEQNCKLYPSYKKVLETKNLCYPPRASIKITESSAEVKLQQLLDHTAQRIVQTQEEVIDTLTDEELQNLKLFCKWGCDGTSRQSEYKQTFEGENISDASIFFTSVVPLQLVYTDTKLGDNLIIWKNPRTSSPRFCRPLRMQFLQETTESTEAEIRHVENQINTLLPFERIFKEKCVKISYIMNLTMIDGKVCSAITGTKSSQRCYLCGATSKDFNDISKILKLPVLEENLKFGLSTLHAWIRFFECILHLSYKLFIKKWQARSAEEKKAVDERKKGIQREFRLQLGLIVDKPKPGFGSSNDGNTARRFFENSQVSANITGIDEALIKRFHVILQVISSGYDINYELFEKFSIDTAKLFVNLYPWYYMPTSVHKVLVHGKQVIENALLPIGQLSEEAQEARNKDIKKYRAEFSRKFSRVKTMEDVFNRLLVSSDPYISSIRKLPKKKLKQFSPEALEMLIAAVPQDQLRIGSDVDSDSEIESELTVSSESD